MKKILIYGGRFIGAFSLIILLQQLAYSFLSLEALYFFPSIALATFLMLIIVEKDQTLDLGMIQPRSFQLHGMGFILGLFLIVFSFLFIWLFQAIRINEIMFHFTQLRQFILLTILFLIVSFQEELFFRGYLYAHAQNLFQNTTVSILSTSFLFSVTHSFNPNALSTPIPLINIFLAGILLGILRERSNGIWMPIGFHWSWNLFQGGLLGFHVSGLPMESFIQIQPTSNSWLSGGEFGAEGSIVTTFLFILCILIDRYVIQKRKR